MSTNSRQKTKPVHFSTDLARCFALAILLVTSCVLLAWVPQLYNNWQLRRFANNLFEYSLPPDTQIVSQSAEVGLSGNGNHCDFEARQEMITKLSGEEIEAYYGSLTFPPVNNHNEGLSPQARGKPRPVFVTFEGEANGEWKQFTISLIDFGYSPGLDLRCH